MGTPLRLRGGKGFSEEDILEGKVIYGNFKVCALGGFIRWVTVNGKRKMIKISKINKGNGPDFPEEKEEEKGEKKDEEKKDDLYLKGGSMLSWSILNTIDLNFDTILDWEETELYVGEKTEIWDNIVSNSDFGQLFKVKSTLKKARSKEEFINRYNLGRLKYIFKIVTIIGVMIWLKDHWIWDKMELMTLKTYFLYYYYMMMITGVIMEMMRER